MAPCNGGTPEPFCSKTHWVRYFASTNFHEIRIYEFFKMLKNVTCFSHHLHPKFLRLLPQKWVTENAGLKNFNNAIKKGCYRARIKPFFSLRVLMNQRSFQKNLWPRHRWDSSHIAPQPEVLLDFYPFLGRFAPLNSSRKSEFALDDIVAMVPSPCFSPEIT